jgi:hypothetical protein
VNDPSLIALVNKLQDVFTTVGVSVSLLTIDISTALSEALNCGAFTGPKSHRSSPDCSGGIAIEWQELGIGEHSGQRFVRFKTPDTLTIAY